MKLLFIALLAAVVFISGCTAGPAKDYTGFTTCLKEAGISEYGLWSCGKCARVRLTLGEAHNNLEYVECSPQCVRDASGNLPDFCRGFESQTDRCLEIGVVGTPSWVENNEIIHVGDDLNQLSEVSGCPLPE